MRRPPVGLANIANTRTQQEGLELLTGDALGAHGIVAGAHQIADGLIGLIRNDDRREISRPRQTGQHHGVAPVGLDAITGTFWNQ